MKVELGAVIAERRLRVIGRPELEVRVRIGTPRPFPDDPNTNYYCPYQIHGVGSGKVRYAGGVDALQALELAIHILPTELDALRQTCPGLGWVDAPEGDYGFSHAASTFAQNGAPRHDDD
jgi:hypothetical protein